MLVSGKLLPPEPIMCFDCQGSELAQGAVAMLRWKTSLLLSCRPEGCWDEEPTALRLNQGGLCLRTSRCRLVVYSVLRKNYSISWRKNK